jgi:hypothetical protein
LYVSSCFLYLVYLYLVENWLLQCHYITLIFCFVVCIDSHDINRQIRRLDGRYFRDCGKVAYANIRLIIVSITEFQEILKAKASFIDHVLNWWSRQKKTLKYPVDSFVKLCRNDSGHLGFSISAKLRRITYSYQMIIQELWWLAPLSTIFQLQCISWWSVWSFIRYRIVSSNAAQVMCTWYNICDKVCQ